MKYLIPILLIVLAACGSEILNENDVPEAVKTVFVAEYPNAKKISWEKIGRAYHVDFRIGNNREVDLWFTENGSISKRKIELEVEELPTGVLNKLKRDYADFVIDDPEKIVKSEMVYYRIELESKTEEFEIAFDESGKQLSKVPD